jgi:hypothetical protein
LRRVLDVNEFDRKDSSSILFLCVWFAAVRNAVKPFGFSGGGGARARLREHGVSASKKS